MSSMEISQQNITGKPLVSIITIVLNGEKIIRRTMDSVFRQSYKNVEYIVIDGGSSDRTVSVIKEYETQLAFWRSEPDKGISDAFNKGIRRAKGEIIGLINAGDWYAPDALQQVVNTFVAEREVGVVCGALQFWKGTSKEYRCNSEPHLLEREMTVTHPSCFILSELYTKAGFYSDRYNYAMDYELLLRLKRQGAKFVSLDSILANMQHDGVSEANWKAALRETHRARTEILGCSFFSSIWYYYFLVVKRWSRIQLERLGMDRILHFYKNRIALVRKTK